MPAVGGIDTVPGAFTRLEALLGVADLSTVTEEHLQLLIDGAVREDTDLEFKEALYAEGEQDRRALATDLAALANTVGGVLIIGLRERDGLAVGRVPVALSEHEELRMRQALAGNVAPVLQPTAVHRIRSAEDGMGYFLITVARSADRPHAVRVNNGLRYPVRNGPSTRYLAESEVADAYRSRFQVAAQQVEFLEQIESEAMERLDQTASAWLTLSLVPDTPGTMHLRYRTIKTMQEWVDNFQFPRVPYTCLNSVFDTAYAGVRRVVLSQLANQDSGLAQYGHLELHTDGSGVGAVPVWTSDDDEVPYLAVGDEFLFGETVALLAALAAHATDNTFTTGPAIVRAALVNRISILDRPMRIAHARGFLPSRHEPVRLGQPRADVPESDHSVDIGAVRLSSRDLLVSVRFLLNDLLQAFGIPETYQVDPEGRLRIRYFTTRSQAAVRQWADANGAELTESTVESEAQG